jgi:hypothetical protein
MAKKSAEPEVEAEVEATEPAPSAPPPPVEEPKQYLQMEATATGASAPRVVTRGAPVIRFARSRYSHRAAIRQWKLSRLMGRRVS